MVNERQIVEYLRVVASGGDWKKCDPNVRVAAAVGGHVATGATRNDRVLSPSGEALLARWNSARGSR